MVSSKCRIKKPRQVWRSLIISSRTTSLQIQTITKLWTCNKNRTCNITNFMDLVKINNSRWCSSNRCSMFNTPTIRTILRTSTILIPCLILQLMEARWDQQMTSPRMDTDQQQAKNRTQKRPYITIKELQLHTSQLRTIDSNRTIQYTKCRKPLQRILPLIKTNHTIQ